MVKNGPKMAEIILGATYMLNNNIWNIFSFSAYTFSYLFSELISLDFVKIKGLYKYQKEKY